MFSGSGFLSMFGILVKKIALLDSIFSIEKES
jgi:hypothetical protein